MLKINLEVGVVIQLFSNSNTDSMLDGAFYRHLFVYFEVIMPPPPHLLLVAGSAADRPTQLVVDDFPFESTASFIVQR